MLCHLSMLPVYSPSQGLDRFLDFGAAIAISDGSFNRLQGGFT